MKHLSWKYIAGLIDGEGCLDFQITVERKKTENIRRYNMIRVRLALTESCKFVLENFQNNFGGGLSYREGKGQWKGSWNWSLTGKRARGFLQNIFKHLLIKKEQAKFMIWYHDNVRGKILDEKVREIAREELKAMKVHPQRLSDWAVANVTEAIVQQDK